MTVFTIRVPVVPYFLQLEGPLSANYAKMLALYTLCYQYFTKSSKIVNGLH